MSTILPSGSLDTFSDQTPKLGDPCTRAAAVTPSDTVALAEVPRALWIGTGGTLVMQGSGTAAQTYQNVPNGYLFPFRAQYVKATGTTCSGIVALY